MYSVIGELRVNNRPTLNRSSTVEPYPSISLDLRTKFTQNITMFHWIRQQNDPIGIALLWITHCPKFCTVKYENQTWRCIVYYAIHKRCGRSDEQSKIYRKSKLRCISDKKNIWWCRICGWGRNLPYIYFASLLEFSELAFMLAKRIITFFFSFLNLESMLHISFWRITTKKNRYVK